MPVGPSGLHDPGELDRQNAPEAPELRGISRNGKRFLEERKDQPEVRLLTQPGDLGWKQVAYSHLRIGEAALVWVGGSCESLHVPHDFVDGACEGGIVRALYRLGAP